MSRFMQAITDLPVGFSALHMETDSIKLAMGHDNTAFAEPELLCRLLGDAPASYRRALVPRLEALSARWSALTARLCQLQDDVMVSRQ
jgi:hypothetical protein